MKVNISVDLEDLNDAFIESLRDAYILNHKPNKIDNSDEVIPVDQEFLDAVDLVLRYYQDYAQQKVWDSIKEGL